ncbi:MAG TPA: putative sulfate exporter family transporter [Ktedonobacteraceae bacterium]|nr:putative sulfate exporter family transporter [Ktedonobacteraceae bacterium]
MSAQISAGLGSGNRSTLRGLEFAISLLIVIVLSVAVWWLTKRFPLLFTGNLNSVLKTIEFPVYAILLGFAARGILSLLGLQERLSGAFRTEFFLKTGVVLLGASINLVNLVKIGAGGIIQSVILIGTVFFTAWFLGRLFKIDNVLRALIASAISICGVSASIAAGAAVQAKREQLAYVGGLVVVFALPLIFLQPLIAHILNLSQQVAGAWIGGSIDTSAAVAASGAIAGNTALVYATSVKLVQSAFIGLVAFLLTIYWITRVEKDSTRERPPISEIFTRFPKFVIGFILASVVVSLLAGNHLLGSSTHTAAVYADITALRVWFFTLAFVSIGLSFKVEGLRQAGWRPVAVFGLGVIFNALIALLVAYVLFGVLAIGG